MMILLLIVCSLLPMAVGLALLATAPETEHREPSPAELSTSRPVVCPWSMRARVAASRAWRLALRAVVRPRRIRGDAVFTVAADVTAAHRIIGGRVADLWSISDSHRPLPCR
jgi:hypothetical protein